jgi:hypothetical protein
LLFIYIFILFMMFDVVFGSDAIAMMSKVKSWWFRIIFGVAWFILIYLIFDRFQNDAIANEKRIHDCLIPEPNKYILPVVFVGSLVLLCVSVYFSFVSRHP